MTIEQVSASTRAFNPGRTAAWLAKQVEIGLASVDLSLSQYRVLALLGSGSDLSSSLAERLAIRPSSVTAVIDGLVARGLVVRTHNEDDRRRISLALTADGVSTLRSADRAVDDRLAEVASALGNPKSSSRAIDSLALWHDALVAHRASRVPR